MITLAKAGIHFLSPTTYTEWRLALTLEPGKQAWRPQSDTVHGKATAEWLLKSQQGGYSAAYSLMTGWMKPFAETTGYIIPSMLSAAKTYKKKKYRESALVAADWLLTQQQTEGSFIDLDKIPRVFDTGQVIFGLVAAYQQTKKKSYLAAAVRGADWMLQQQARDGSWVKGTYQGKASTYYARAAWALLVLWQVTKKERYKQAAQKQLAWVMKQQDKDGWFRNASFFSDERPVLHTIAYTMEGLLASSKILKDKRIGQAAEKCAHGLLKTFEQHGFLSSYYTKGFTPASQERCPTGMAQTALVFEQLGQRYKRVAVQLKNELKGYQNITTGNIRGAIPGSVPALGSYMRWTYPNWAAKFWLDLCQ